MSQVWSQRVSAAGFGGWMVLDMRRVYFDTALAVVLSSGATLTYTVQHTFDPVATELENVVITRSGTTATLLWPNHGLSVDDSVTVAGALAPFDGTFAVASVVDDDTITYTVLNSGATRNAPGAKFSLQRVFAHATLAGLSARGQGNYAFPPIACRLNVTAYTDGFADLLIVQGGA